MSRVLILRTVLFLGKIIFIFYFWYLDYQNEGLNQKKEKKRKSLDL